MQLVDNGNPVDAIYLDFSKAFDAVPHRRLMVKLESLGIDGSVFQWIKYFLQDRSQYVEIEKERSVAYKPSSGVPQGSVLLPLLFAAFVNDLDRTVKNASLLKFADDLKLFMAINKSDPLSTIPLQSDLNSLNDWSNDWLLKFNATKCSTLHFGNGNPEVTYHIGQTPLATNSVERDLGVLISSDMKMHSQVMKCVQTAQNVLWSIKRTITSRDKDIVRLLYIHLVRPHLEFSSPAWNPYEKRDIDLLERVQRRATKLIPELKRLPYEERLKRLNLQSLEVRRKRQDLLEIFKILKGNSPLSRDIFLYPAERSRRTNHPLMLKKHRFHLDCRKFSFANRSVNEWNMLPADIVNSSTISVFKRKLDLFL
jgi:ribonuclease P/MRP protein subunit RPP40